MAYEVVVPRLGLTMEEAKVLEWYKKDGETIEKGEPLFSVETDKTVLDVEAPFSGIFYKIPNLPDDTLPIGVLIGYILDPGEELPVLDVEGVKQPVATVAKEEMKVEPTELREVSFEGKLASPAARRRAQELDLDWREIEPIDGRPILIADVEQYAEERKQRAVFEISPLAKRIAQEQGVNLAELAKQVTGKITREDVEAYIESQRFVPEQKPLVQPVSSQISMSMTRRTIARRMSESARSTAPVTLTTEADVTELVNLREVITKDLKGSNLLIPTYTEMLLKLVSVALQEHPYMNASLGENEIILHEAIHIGMAIDTEEGLIVPVLKNMADKSIQEICREARLLVENAHDRKLPPEAFEGGTFTVSNLGTYGIDAFTPIINLPECAILGVGRILDKPWEHNGEIVLRKVVAFSLTFDHRVVDGGPAARFSDRIRIFAEKPNLWLLR